MLKRYKQKKRHLQACSRRIISQKKNQPKRSKLITYERLPILYLVFYITSQKANYYQLLENMRQSRALDESLIYPVYLPTAREESAAFTDETTNGHIRDAPPITPALTGVERRKGCLRRL